MFFFYHENKNQNNRGNEIAALKPKTEHFILNFHDRRFIWGFHEINNYWSSEQVICLALRPIQHPFLVRWQFNKGQGNNNSFTGCGRNRRLVSGKTITLDILAMYKSFCTSRVLYRLFLLAFYRTLNINYIEGILILPISRESYKVNNLLLACCYPFYN